MKSYDVIWVVAIVVTCLAIFAAFIFLLGVYDVAVNGGNSDAAKFAGWVVNAIR
jgi:hypothetical protein